MTRPQAPRRRAPGLATALASASVLALALGPGQARGGGEVAGQAASVAPDAASTLAVQFTDAALRAPGWRERLDLAAKVGAAVVRVDFNWPWTEPAPGRYDWSVYDAFAAELAKRGLRPLFILHRPNPLHGRPLPQSGADVSAPPETEGEVAAFARWAAAAAARFKAFDPIWEIWNEPDGEGFWPPRPEPSAYVRLARDACAAIRGAVPGAFVVGPAAAEMPTVWDGTKPLVEAVLRDAALTGCLSALSLHTHRFGQAPETAARDYAVFRRVRARLKARDLPLLDTEWGDAVHAGGLTEARQAAWLPRMVLVNLMEGVALTNWYCLIDTGDDDREREDRFGLVTRAGRLRPAYRAYQVLARELRGYRLQRIVARFDVATAEGTTVLLFCNLEGACKLAAWATGARAARVSVPGWALAGPVVGHLGQTLAGPPQGGGPAVLAPAPEVQFAAVRRLRAEAE